MEALDEQEIREGADSSPSPTDITVKKGEGVAKDTTLPDVEVPPLRMPPAAPLSGGASLPEEWLPEENEEPAVVHGRATSSLEADGEGEYGERTVSEGDLFASGQNGTLLQSFDDRDAQQQPRSPRATQLDQGVTRSLGDMKRMQKRTPAAAVVHTPFKLESCMMLTEKHLSDGLVQKICGFVTNNGNVLVKDRALVGKKVYAIVSGSPRMFIVQDDMQVYILSQDQKTCSLLRLKRESSVGTEDYETHAQAPPTPTTHFTNGTLQSMSLYPSSIHSPRGSVLVEPSGIAAGASAAAYSGSTAMSVSEDTRIAICQETSESLQKVYDLIESLAHRGMGHSRYQEYTAEERMTVAAKAGEQIDWLNQRYAQAIYQNILKLADWHKKKFPTEYEEKKRIEEEKRANAGGGCTVS